MARNLVSTAEWNRLSAGKQERLRNNYRAVSSLLANCYYGDLEGYKATLTEQADHLVPVLAAAIDVLLIVITQKNVSPEDAFMTITNAANHKPMPGFTADWMND